MSGFRFKPSSVTEFSCQGVSTFADYLDLIGIETDNDGYINTNDLKTTCAASADTVAEMVLQYNDEYYNINTANNLYQTWLANNYPATYPGYVKLPFKINGIAPSILLPGTTPHFKKQLCTVGGGQRFLVERTAEYLHIYNTAAGPGLTNIYLYPSDFPDGVIPIYLAFRVTGGGGGGGGSDSTYSGCGGGSGGTRMGILTLGGATGLELDCGAGGAGGAHHSGAAYSGDSGTASYITVLGAGNVYTGLAGGGGTKGSSSGKGGAGGTTSRTGSVVSGIYWWNPYGSTTVSLIEASNGKSGGVPGVDGGTFDNYFRGLSTVNDLSKLDIDVLKIGTDKGYSVVGVEGHGGGGGGAPMDGKGGNGTRCGGNDAGYDGYRGGGGGGGGFTTFRYVGGGSGGGGVIELWY